jgi:hypothetical protein
MLLSTGTLISIPNSVELLDYDNEADLRGGCGSTTTIRCAWADWQSVKNAYIDAIDPNDGTLRIVKGHLRVSSKGSAAATDGAILTFQAIPLPLAEAFRLDQPFQVKGRAFPMAFTVGGSYVWVSDGATVDSTNTKVLPVKEWTRADLILYGRRSTFTISSYSSYFDKVNTNPITDGTLNGCDTSQLLCKGVQFTPCIDAKSGAEAWEVEVPLAYLASGWTNDWREKNTDADPTGGGCPKLDSPRLGTTGGDKKYGDTDFTTMPGWPGAAYVPPEE